MPEPRAVPAIAELLLVAVEAVDRASQMMRQLAPGNVTMKGDRDPATEVDYAIEREIRTFLLDRAPDVGFLGEESGSVGEIGIGLHWALDPVDGTVNFMRSIPLCAISLALLRDGEPALSVIDVPFQEMRYTAVAGRGARRNNIPIQVSGVSRLSDAVVTLGDYAVGENAVRKNRERIAITERVASTVARVRMIGSAAIDLAWVADGRVDASVMLSNKPWDTAAGVLLAREAGAIVIDRAGQRHSAESNSTIATTPGLQGAILDLLRP